MNAGTEKTELERGWSEDTGSRLALDVNGEEISAGENTDVAKSVRIGVASSVAGTREVSKAEDELLVAAIRDVLYHLGVVLNRPWVEEVWAVVDCGGLMARVEGGEAGTAVVFV